MPKKSTNSKIAKKAADEHVAAFSSQLNNVSSESDGESATSEKQSKKGQNGLAKSRKNSRFSRSVWPFCSILCSLLKCYLQVCLIYQSIFIYFQLTTQINFSMLMATEEVDCRLPWMSQQLLLLNRRRKNWGTICSEWVTDKWGR